MIQRVLWRVINDTIDCFQLTERSHVKPSCSFLPWRCWDTWRSWCRTRCRHTTRKLTKFMCWKAKKGSLSLHILKMLAQLNLCLMRFSLNINSEYLEEVDILDELVVDTLKWKHGIRLWLRMYTNNSALDISHLKTHPGGFLGVFQELW